MAITVITEPGIEPIRVADLKNDVKVDADLTEDDFLIAGLIKAARRWAEGFLRRALITQTLEVVFDKWPEKTVIKVPRAPLQSVASVKYYDEDDTEYTLSSGSYFVDTVSEPGRIVLNSGESWPSTALRPANAVIVRFDAGYGNDESDVPADMVHALRLLVGHWYENREAVASTGAVPKEVPFGVEALLWMDRVMEM